MGVSIPSIKAPIFSIMLPQQLRKDGFLYCIDNQQTCFSVFLSATVEALLSHGALASASATNQRRIILILVHFYIWKKVYRTHLKAA